MRAAPGQLTAWPDPIQGPVRVSALVRLGAAPYWWQTVLTTARPVVTAPAPTAVTRGTAYWWSPQLALARGGTQALVVAPPAPGAVTPPAPTLRVITLRRPTQPISMAAAGTGPTAPMATNTSVANQVPIAQALDPTQSVYPIPSDLAAVLDNATALTMREYVALHPDDFQAFLTQYADYLVLRSDLFMEALKNPPTGGYQPTPAMLASLGAAAYKVVQGLNGVAAGRYGDIFGIASTVAGQIPAINPDLLHAVQGLALGYRAVKSLADVVSLASAHGASVLDLTSAAGMAGVYPGLQALQLGPVLMAAGLVVDIAFTIIGNAPDIQKAIDVALDVASLAVLFIPGIGLVIAIVIQLVKFIIDLFGGDLFGGGLSHEQREVLETARYSEQVAPMYPDLAAAYTPRELFRTIVAWGSGYCGGHHPVAFAVTLILKAGDQLRVGGRLVTLDHDALLGPGDNEQAGGCYWLRDQGFGDITNDEQAWALARYATDNGVLTMAQAGIADWRKVQFNDPAQKLIMARAAPMKEFVRHGLDLDQIDQIAAEYRAQPALAALADAFGYGTWQAMLAEVVADEWHTFGLSVTHGTLTDFARMNGYRTMYDFRRAALGSYQDAFGIVQALEAWYRTATALAVSTYAQATAEAGAAYQAFTSGGA